MSENALETVVILHRPREESRLRSLARRALRRPGIEVPFSTRIPVDKIDEQQDSRVREALHGQITGKANKRMIAPITYYPDGEFSHTVSMRIGSAFPDHPMI